MNPESDRPDASTRTLDDDQLGALVRAVADDWRMPPQRLDQPTWRDRVNGPGIRRRGRLARLVGPAAAALVATVAVAFVAVWLTSPRPERAVTGNSPDVNGATARPSASAGAVASPLPKLLRNGDLPTPARIMVRFDGRYQIADLSSGGTAPVGIASYTGPTSVLARPGGGWVCICSNWIERGSAAPSGVRVSLEAVDAFGAQTATHAIRTIEGSPDPKWAGVYQVQVADVGTTVSADGRVAFVGWSAKNGAVGWTSGIDVVDVETGSVIGTIELPVQEPAVSGEWPTTRVAPRIALAPAGDRALISSFWYEEDPTTATPSSGTDHWTAAFDGRSLGALAPADAARGDRCSEFESGLIDGSTWYALCSTPGGALTIERNQLDGQAVDRTEAGLPAVGPARSLVARSGAGLFIWDPIATRLTRFDLQTAAVVSTTFPETVGSASPLDDLAALGRRVGGWLAPSALAKVILEPAIVVSADGTRVYALGVDPLAGGELGGSLGVFAFDAASLQPIGHWPASADYISLAISPDGRFVYAAGQGGRDSAGNTSSNGASITVYDTANGSVRLIAGQLGSGELWFPGPVVQ